MKACGRPALSGGKCELAEDHDGEHQRTSWPYGYDKAPFVFTWTDESQRRLADKHGSRFD